MHIYLRYLFLLLAGESLAQPYPPVHFGMTTTTRFATRIPKTAQLLTTAEPGQIRILVYGQSISRQDWWLEVRSFLKQRYPKVTITMVNQAIGGFSSERLKQMVENDVMAFYPDLILLHDYGNQPDYEQIIRSIRSRTTAEVAIQTDHVAVGQNDAWHDQHSSVWLPALCDTYGLALIDVRTAWKAYLAKHRLAASALLTDAVHLNGHGNYLMAEIVKRYFNTLPVTAMTTELEPSAGVSILKPGRDFTLRNHTLRLRVTGNRIDVRWKDSAAHPSAVTVTIDGQEPSASVGCFYHTRPAREPEGSFPTHIGQLLTLRLAGQLQPEDWTLILTDVDSLRQEVRFRLHGSRTGPDGSGSSDSLFTSGSGRVVIEPQYWFRRNNPGDFGQFNWLKPGDTLQWNVLSMCHDTIIPAAGHMQTLVQGIVNGEHVLTLAGQALTDLREIRVYRPPLPE